MSPMNYPDNDVLVNRPLYVRELQDYLAKISTRYPSIPHLATDGIFGPETTASVRAFQELNQLSPTGRVDRITWETIVAVYTRIVDEEAPALPLQVFPRADYVVRNGDTGSHVIVIQILLDTLAGRYLNFLSVPMTGTYDQDTQNAIQILQGISSQDITGDTDKNTWNELVRLIHIQDPDKTGRE